MKAVILTVGTEILFGQIVNTNSAFLSRELQNLGIDVMYHYSVGDNPNRLKRLLETAYKDCDLVITTGGLGPTEDDLTKETIGNFFNEEIVEFPEYTVLIKEHFKKAGYNWTDNNLSQAYFPKNSIILENPIGTAPGYFLERDGKCVATLPGPPREMKIMFENELKPILAEKQDNVIYYKIIRTFGIGESTLETKLMDLIDNQKDPTIATYAKEGECSLRITSKKPTFKEAKEQVDIMINNVNQIIGEHIYSYDNEDINEVVGRILIDKNISFSCCESCTGGALSSKLIQIPNISKVFDSGLVTYSWNSKMRELGVKQETLEKFSAESHQVCREMVEGLYEKCKSDFCISITGIAGPHNISCDKPAGLAYVGIKYKDKTEIITISHRNVSRVWNINYMVLRCLYEIYIRIK